MAMQVDGQANGSAKQDEKTSADYYFDSYSHFGIHEEMLKDVVRTKTYMNSIVQNGHIFKGKTVLDIGCGTGILSLFAAKAGAAHVYGIECSSIAEQARQIVADNGFSDKVTIVHGKVEEVELPVDKVDVIISEWMGYFLLRESMLDSVLVARDKFLKPGGALYPSHARMLMAPIRTNMHARRLADFQGSMEGWADFLDDMKNYYQVDLGVLSEGFRKEQAEYYLQTSQWTDIHPSQMLGPPTVFKEYDLLHTTIEELKAGLEASFELRMVDGGPVEGLCSWFDVTFAGSPESPADQEVRLDTAPDATGATHWGQQTFYPHPAIDCSPNDCLAVNMKVDRRKDNHRLLAVSLSVKVQGSSIHAQSQQAPRSFQFNIE